MLATPLTAFRSAPIGLNDAKSKGCQSFSVPNSRWGTREGRGFVMSRITRRLVFLTAVLGAALLIGSGCGTKTKTGQLKGRVLFKGQPVPAGYISFTPDATKGNHGSV